MQLIVVDTDGPVKLRAAAAFCLMLAGDIAVPSVLDPDTSEERAAAISRLPDHERVAPPLGAVPAGTILSVSTPTSGALAPGMTIHAPSIPAVHGSVIGFPPAPPVPSTPGHNWPNESVFNQPAPAAAVPASTIATAIAPTTAGVPSVPQPLPGTLAPPMPSAPQPPNFSQQPSATTAQAPSSGSTPSSASLPYAADEFDSAGLPWDGRIHQKGRSKKKDGTWKLQKGLDPVFAQAVVTELAAKRRAAPAAEVPAQSSGVPQPPQAVPPLPPLGAGPLMPDPPRPAGMLPELGAPYGTITQPQFNHASVPYPSNEPQVPLPPPLLDRITGYPTHAVPVPPQPNGPPASMVPPPPATAQVSVAPQPGAAGGGNPAVRPIVMKPAAPEVTPYRLLMDKLTAAVSKKQLDPRCIAGVCQKHGAPNFAELGNPEYAHLVAGAERDFDSLIAGLPVEGIA